MSKASSRAAMGGGTAIAADAVDLHNECLTTLLTAVTKAAALRVHMRATNKAITPLDLARAMYLYLREVRVSDALAECMPRPMGDLDMTIDPAVVADITRHMTTVAPGVKLGPKAPEMAATMMVALARDHLARCAKDDRDRPRHSVSKEVMRAACQYCLNRIEGRRPRG